MSEQFLNTTANGLNFDIAPCEKHLDFDDKSRFIKMKTTPTQVSQLNSLVQQLPLALSADALNHAYILKFPEGLPQTLMKLNQGGESSVIVDANHKIAGHASLFKIDSKVMLLNAFTAMSVATGQYFLSQINEKMGLMNLNLEKILEFLYGDKRAELLSELNFVKYAYENYNSIMNNEIQKLATITNLQETRKVAMKDIEFYIMDLDSKSKTDTKDYTKFSSLMNEVFQIKDSLELSVQLYVISSLMEVYYSQNWDESYIDYLEKSVSTFIDKYEKRVLANFSVLKSRISDLKSIVLPMKKVDTTQLELEFTTIITSLSNGDKNYLIEVVHNALAVRNKSSEYYLSNDGNLYCKI